MIDFVTVLFDGAKLHELPNEVGADSEQFTAQQSRAASALGVLSLLLALSQHFIIWLLAECNGVPDTTPSARAKTNKSKVSRFTIKIDYIAQG